MARQGPKRKLIARSLLTHLKFFSDAGVKNPRLLRDFDLFISSPSLKVLLQHFRSMQSLLGSEDPANVKIGRLIEQSLFPRWLDDSSNKVQEAPANYNYTGVFPFGSWEQLNVNTERLHQFEVAHGTTERSVKATR